jgi:hypothetical protein
MEHLVSSLGKNPDLAEYIEGGYDEEEGELDDIAEETKEENGSVHREPRYRNGDDMTPEMEARLRNGLRNSKRYSQMSIVDVADIIRNISDQCAAAVEGLQLAHDAEVEAEELSHRTARQHHRHSNLSTVTASDDGQSAGSEMGEDSFLHPSGRTSSIPPTPDLIHNRSSTSMSIASSTTTPERNSQQYHTGADIPTKIVEDSEEEIEGRSEGEPEMTTKSNLLRRPAGARISALGGH